MRELDDSARGIRGDTLVFLPGEKQIREAADALEEAELHNTEVLPLFSRLSAREQERIFERHGERRVVLATNVAETSLTVPGIRFVVDSGLARISRYSVRAQSAAAADRAHLESQRRSAQGPLRTRSRRHLHPALLRRGLSLREEFTPPEVLRTNLASVILRMAALGLGEPAEFPFLDPPDTRLVNDGVRLLQELKAMDEDRRVTSLGEQIAGLPVDPRLGPHAARGDASQLPHRDAGHRRVPRSAGSARAAADAQQHAAQKHALFADARSDFVTVLNLWRAYGEQAAALSAAISCASGVASTSCRSCACASGRTCTRSSQTPCASSSCVPIRLPRELRRPAPGDSHGIPRLDRQPR